MQAHILVAIAALVGGMPPGDAVARVQSVPALHGPGRHWIHRVGAGLARFDAEATVAVDANFDGTADASVTLTGPTVVVRSRARALAGRHRSHLDLEIVSMTLTGTLSGFGGLTFRAGDGIANLAADGPLHSPGTSDEIPGDPRRAQDWFDLRFEVDLNGVRLRNPEPFRVGSVIDRLPPIGSTFTSSGPPAVLVTEGGTPVLQIVGATNTIVRPATHACEPGGVDRDDVLLASTTIATRCNCQRSGGYGRRGSPRCNAKVIRTAVRTGLLEPSCGRAVREHAAELGCVRTRVSPDPTLGRGPGTREP